MWYFISMRTSSGKAEKKSGVADGQGGMAGGCEFHHSEMPTKTLSRRTRRYKYYCAGTVSLITFLVYLASLKNGFVNWDDGTYVIANPYIHSFNLTFLRWAFLEFYAANWHPLTWMSHAVDYALWGMNPLGHHLTSIILHSVNTFMVVVIATGLVEVRGDAGIKGGLVGAASGQTALIAGVLTGLLFGLHPLHVESVAWISERKDLLCALFFLLSISSYIKYIDEMHRANHETSLSFLSNKHYLSAIGFSVLALLSKPMAVTLPFVLIVLDWYPFERIRSFKMFRIVIFEKLPFIALALMSSILTFLAQRSAAAVGHAPLSMRMLVASHSLVAYLLKMVVPRNLLPLYLFPVAEAFSASDYYPSVALVMGISAACLAVAGKNKVWSVAWCYYVITLLPVLGLVQVGLQSMADRYTYLPSLGLFLLTGLGVAWVFERANGATRKGRAAKAVGIAAVVLVFVSLSYLTIEQIGIWKDGLSLWNYQIKKEPERVYIAYVNRGSAFFQEKGQPDKAISDFDEAIVLNPSYADVYRQRALAYEKKGQDDRAIEDFEKAAALQSPYGNAYRKSSHYNYEIHVRPLIEIHVRLGVLYGKAGRYEISIEHFNKAVALDPQYSLSYNDRGFTYFISGQYDKALGDYNRAIEQNGTYAFAYLNRGNLYLKTGNEKLAREDFQKACDLKSQGGCNALRAMQNVRTNHRKK